jgi:GTP-binding protein
VRGGHGGKGSASFRREPFIPRGGPDGGDGGRGGSVVIEATTNQSDLSLFKQRSRWLAEAGANGAGGRKTGKRGADLSISVPVGTIVLDPDGALVADLDTPGATAMVAKGGEGGRGNVHFKSSTRRAPDYAEPGTKGEELDLTLDLKLIADVGLVGAPNAGKSSLLRALTAAQPKVADYPFTTLDPELGVAQSDAGRVVIADIPGLIEGAAQGAGLGQRFLRHVERTRVLVYVLDGSGPDPWQDLATVRHEVEAFAAELTGRPYLVAVNKLDLATTKRLKARTRRFKGSSRTLGGASESVGFKGILFVSALTGEGLPDLMAAVTGLLATAPEPLLMAKPRPMKLPVRPGPDLVVVREPWGYAVRGERVERLVERTDLDSEGALARFQSELDRIGVNSALEAAEVQPGDTVRISGIEFEYQP